MENRTGLAIGHVETDQIETGDASQQTVSVLEPRNEIAEDEHSDAATAFQQPARKTAIARPMRSFTFQINRRSLYYILLQRTHLQSSLNRLFWMIGLRKVYEYYFLLPIEWFRIRTVTYLFSFEINNEFAGIRHLLPPAAKEILDIGSGIGGIDVLLNYHYKACAINPTFTLIDTDGISDTSHYGYSPKGLAHNCFAVTREFLEVNGIQKDQIHLIDVAKEDLPQAKYFDLAISLLSWGFHYPVGTYLDWIASRLQANGKVILDVRRGTDGMDRLKLRFNNVQVILEQEKFLRVICTLPKHQDS